MMRWWMNDHSQAKKTGSLYNFKETPHPPKQDSSMCTTYNTAENVPKYLFETSMEETEK